MRAVAVFLALLACVSIVGCGRRVAEGASGSGPQPTIAQEIPKGAGGNIDPGLVTAANDFGFRLYTELAKTDSGKNLFISPTSIEIALAMTYNGARGGTQQAMAKALGIGAMGLEQLNKANASMIGALRSSDPKVHLAIANSLWAKQGITFLPDFLQRNKDNYTATIDTLDFTQPSAADRINKWAEGNTGGMIRQIVSPPDIQPAYMVLANAVYFKGEWFSKFDPAMTKDGDFTLLDGSTKRLPMMENTGDYYYSETPQYQSIRMPYGDGAMCAVVILPRRRTNPADMLRGATSAQWAALTSFGQGHGTIVLPRFKADYSAKLGGVLSALGMGVAFTPSADFNGMIPESEARKLPFPLQILEVFHKTALEVYEEGTRAAAVTAVVMGPGGPPPSKIPFVMRVDHPFIFAICHARTGAIVFLGTIGDPGPMPG